MKEMFKNERESEAGESCAGPHNTKREAFTLSEPLIHVQNAGTVRDGASDGVEHALREDEVSCVLGKGAGGQGDAHDK